jgi:hypothetical protein
MRKTAGAMKPSHYAALLSLAAIIATSIGARAAGNVWGKAADNRIYAQTLVNKMAAANPLLVSIGMHVARPGTQDYRIIASTLDVVGKQCDPEDLVVAVDDNSVISAPNLKAGKLGILIPLHDRDGHHIGGFALAFKYKPGDDQARIFTRALALRDRMAKNIPNVESLFDSR